MHKLYINIAVQGKDTMATKKLVSIVIPAHNEELTIKDVLSDIKKETKKLRRYDFELIVVDNNSTDKTAKIASSMGVVVIKEKKKGKGHALVAGFNYGKGDYFVMLDADYSHRAEDLGSFLKYLDKGYGLVIGSRSLGGSDEYDVVRWFGNIFLTFCTRNLLGFPFTDALNGYKAFNSDIAKHTHFHASNFEIEIELCASAIKKGYDIKEFPSHERARAGGEMKSFAPIHGTKFLLKIIEEGVKVRFHKVNTIIKRKKK